MVRKEIQYQEARHLRSTVSMSVGDIARQIGVAKSTVYLWTKDIPIQKICAQCLKRKGRRQFTRNLQQADGLHCYCRDCVRINLTPERYAQQDLRNKERQAAIRTYIDTWKLKGCWRCGYKKYAKAIDAHHVDPSEKDFSLYTAAGRKYSMDRVKRELEKCVPLCALCHREFHLGVFEIEPR